MALLAVVLSVNLISCSDDDENELIKTIHVENGGSLATLMTTDEQLHVVDLTLSGFLNGTDIGFIRGMRNLEKADFTDVHIIGGGSSYYDYDNYTPYQTSDNIFPSNCFAPLSPDHFFKLCEIKLPNSITEIGHDAFAFCTSLTSIKIPDGVTVIGDNAFNCCESLTSVELPNGIMTIGYSAFQGCKSLTSIKIPDGVATIKEHAFSNCTSLTNAELPNGITEVEASVFWDCTSLTNIKIPDGVTTIEPGAFHGCTSLTSVELPYSITTIKQEAFENAGLKEVHIKSSTPPNVDRFAISIYAITLYVPIGSKDAYMAHKIFGEYNIVEE